MDSVFVLYDRLTDSVWYPDEDGALLAVAGSEQGSAIPFLDEPSPVLLGDWLDRHPDSVILLPSEEDFARILQYRNRPYLGASFREREGAVVLEKIERDSPAAAAGIREGEILRELDGNAVDSYATFRKLYRDLRAGDTVELVLELDGERQVVHVTLGAPPGN